MKQSAFLYSIKIVAFSLFFSLIALSLCVIFHAVCGKSEGRERHASADLPQRSVVIIDAGHGGRDGGASSVTGTPEKTLNLEIAKLLEALFSAAGTDVIMTRSEDILLDGDAPLGSKKTADLKNRLIIAEEAVRKYDSAVLVSIHMNKFQTERYRGLQVWYSPNDPGSAGLASLIQNAVRVQLQPDNSRQIKRAGTNIFLLNRASCPAVVVECGFLSNHEEAVLLDSDDYRRRLACVIFGAVAEFLYSDKTES